MNIALLHIRYLVIIDGSNTGIQAKLTHWVSYESNKPLEYYTMVMHITTNNKAGCVD
jgi:hypothetical protein